jgi:adenylate cyclase
MTAGREVERKFVVTQAVPLDLDACESDEIRQGYLAVSPEGTEVRIRARGDRRSLGVKSGPSRTRIEEEIELDDRRFDALWPLTEGRRVRKRRYVIPAAGDRRIELDVYDDQLAGLVTAEIEFDGEHQADRFEPPSWLGVEVTGDGRFSNRALATDGPPG